MENPAPGFPARAAIRTLAFPENRAPYRNCPVTSCCSKTCSVVNRFFSNFIIILNHPHITCIIHQPTTIKFRRFIPIIISIHQECWAEEMNISNKRHYFILTNLEHNTKTEYTTLRLKPNNV
ncbi:unnamed protein product [Spodoptera exigua]|nr:unnamed protein product [Spodoptera exigua]